MDEKTYETALFIKSTNAPNIWIVFARKLDDPVGLVEFDPRSDQWIYRERNDIRHRVRYGAGILLDIAAFLKTLNGETK